MSNKNVSFCGQQHIQSLLKWIFKEFKNEVKLRPFPTPDDFRNAIEREVVSEAFILDAEILGKSVLKFAAELRDKKPALKIVLIVAPTATQEIVEIIKSNAVQGIIVTPFTGEVVCKYIDKILP